MKKSVDYCLKLYGMGLDIYSGTLTRYYCWNWKTITQNLAENLGMNFVMKSPEGDMIPIENEDEKRKMEEAVKEWQMNFLSAIPDEYKVEAWLEDNEHAYYTDKIDWLARGAIIIYQLATILNKPFPKIINRDFDFENHPLCQEASSKGIYTSINNTFMWFPLKGDVLFQYFDIYGEKTIMASIDLLQMELEKLNAATWQADEETILSWRETEYYEPIEGEKSFWSKFIRKSKSDIPNYYTESLAKCAFSILYKTVKFAQKESLPIVLNY